MKIGSRTSLINSRLVGRSKPNCESATDIATSEEENASSSLQMLLESGEFTMSGENVM